MKNINYLAKENCNTKMCKSCIFRTDGKSLPLEPGRLEEIKAYLIGKSAHICHVTEKTCYGGLEFQAQIYFRLGIISEPTVNSFLQKAKEVLKLK